MGTGHSGHAPRIDADEDDPEVGPEDVRHLTLSRIHFGHVLRESHRFPHGGRELPSGTVGDDPSRRGRNFVPDWGRRPDAGGRYAASAAASAASNPRRKSSPETVSS